MRKRFASAPQPSEEPIRPPLFLTLAIVLSLVTLSSPASGLSEITAREVPKADARLLRALSTGVEEVRVIVGVKDGTPSARALLLSPDPAGEPARRIRRIAAQRRLAVEMPDNRFEPLHYYESFSFLSGRATREGVVALTNHPDVSWVTVDGTKKALQRPQAAQVLINSNLANELGFSGGGQTVAVIDTGVDYRVSPLGGGSFPNAKVIGGFDAADEDNDPMDCDGHGTSVASIVAGPTGVAPEAKIVALKVFASTSAANSSCKEEAFDADILQAIDFAITRKAEFGITALNISLGGDFDDVKAGADLGFCDTRVPHYAAAIDSATAGGLVVVVASGNSAIKKGLAEPACVSSAVSVGAVYSFRQSSQGWSDDSGGTLCRDTPVAPDLPTCFSNSNSNLSLLAPGAFWEVVTKGGSSNLRFAGTSASAPAVAGAVALVRQARPDLSPAAVIAILRATGRPVTDPGNGVTTPRIDTLAALQLPAESLGGFEGSPIPIPDGTDSASATATVSGFPGTIARMQAGVQIDHPNPQELRVTLTGPDGTTAVLHDQTGLREHPINANYGRTDVPAQSLSRFSGKSPNGVWRLTVSDRVPGRAAGRIRSFSVSFSRLSACVPAADRLCLNNGRFQLTLSARDPRTFRTASGQAIPQNDLFGYFSLPALTGNPANPEVFVKVLDGTAVNGNFWVFHAGLTDLEYTLTVEDLFTGRQRTYRKDAGSACGGFETGSFPD